MNLVLQPPGSNKCGQACVAMVAGVTLKQSLKAYGLQHATTLYATRNALKKLGFTPAEKLQAFGKKESKLPETCLLMLRWPKRNLGHWVVYHDGQVYDPAGYIDTWEVFLVLHGTASLKYLELHSV